MRIAVWRTGHEIADTLANAVWDGLCGEDHQNYWGDINKNYRPWHYSNGDRSIGCFDLSEKNEWPNWNRFTKLIRSYDIHIGYGILRGMDEVFRACDKAGKPWFNIDKGYWKPGHFDGYYRISLRGTQQTTGLDKLQPDYERWEKLGLGIIPNRIECTEDYTLVCPPTDYVSNYFGFHPMEWLHNALQGGCDNKVVRTKGTETPICWPHVGKAITFNSSVGWEALRQGIPVISDEKHSIVGAYQKMVGHSIHDNVEERRKLFAIQSRLQLTLDEVRRGQLFPLLQELLSNCQFSSAGIPENPLHLMSAPTA